MESSQSSFHGTGWAFPPEFGPAGRDVEMVSGHQDIQECLQILFATQLGERVMREDFGCDLHSVLFAEIDQDLINRLTRLLTDGILQDEPRITLNEVDVSVSNSEDGLLHILIDYTVSETNSRFNMVYPFYLNEAVPSAGALAS